MQSTRRPAFVWFLTLFAAVILSACGKKEATVPAADAKPNAVSQASADASKKGGPGSKQGQWQGQRGGGQGAPAAVITATVREAAFATEVEALGTAKANEAIDVTAKVSNRITAIRFREGQFVRAGEVLVELDAAEAAADLSVAQAALDDSRGQVNRSRELAVTKALSAQQMEQLESTMRANEARVASARARLNELTIRAPFAGRVGLRNVSIGGLVNSGTVITTLDDVSVMKLDFSVPETFLAMLSEGLEVDATSAAYSGQVFKGRVVSVGTRVDPVSRSVTVRAQVANREGKLKPGMFMTVRLVRSDNKALVIPEQALVPERDKQFVFAIRDAKAVKTEIVVGRRRPGEIEVLSGLRAGDVIVSEGSQKIRDGSPIRVAGNGAE
jgi:membrane fusion protein (multidrug efflux system)